MEKAKTCRREYVQRGTSDKMGFILIRKRKKGLCQRTCHQAPCYCLQPSRPRCSLSSPLTPPFSRRYPTEPPSLEKAYKFTRSNHPPPQCLTFLIQLSSVSLRALVLTGCDLSDQVAQSEGTQPGQVLLGFLERPEPRPSIAEAPLPSPPQPDAGSPRSAPTAPPRPLRGLPSASLHRSTAAGRSTLSRTLSPSSCPASLMLPKRKPASENGSARPPSASSSLSESDIAAAGPEAEVGGAPRATVPRRALEFSCIRSAPWRPHRADLQREAKINELTRARWMRKVFITI